MERREGGGGGNGRRGLNYDRPFWKIGQVQGFSGELYNVPFRRLNKCGRHYGVPASCRLNRRVTVIIKEFLAMSSQQFFNFSSRLGYQPLTRESEPALLLYPGRNEGQTR